MSYLKIQCVAEMQIFHPRIELYTGNMRLKISTYRGCTSGHIPYLLCMLVSNALRYVGQLCVKLVGEQEDHYLG